MAWLRDFRSGTWEKVRGELYLFLQGVQESLDGRKGYTSEQYQVRSEKGKAGGYASLGGDAAVLDIQLRSLIGDTGAGGHRGLVPAPVAGDAAAGRFLKADATWSVPAGGGGGSPNLDGGFPDTIYGGVTPIDGGTP